MGKKKGGSKGGSKLENEVENGNFHQQDPPVANHEDGDSSAGEEDGETVQGQETRGQMLQRHKKELAAHKKAVQRLGKKGKDEATKLQQEIEQRHAKELEEVTVRMAALEASNAEPEAGENDEGAKDEAHVSKAAKRRAKAAKEDTEREARIEAEKAAIEAEGPAARLVEEDALRRRLQPLGLRMREIRADGHCLYRAVADQMFQAAPEAITAKSHDFFKILRALTAERLITHPSAYLPFLDLPTTSSSTNTGNSGDAVLGNDENDAGVASSPVDATSNLRVSSRAALRDAGKAAAAAAGVTDEEFERLWKYCLDVRESATWGGHVELLALCRRLGVRAEVITAARTIEIDGRVDEDGAASSSPLPSLGSSEVPPMLRLCFLEHAYGLGEHYNSTEPSVATASAVEIMVSAESPEADNGSSGQGASKDK